MDGRLLTEAHQPDPVNPAPVNSGAPFFSLLHREKGGLKAAAHDSGNTCADCLMQAENPGTHRPIQRWFQRVPTSNGP